MQEAFEHEYSGKEGFPMGSRGLFTTHSGLDINASAPHRFQGSNSRKVSRMLEDLAPKSIDILVVEDSDAVRAVLAMSLKIAKVPVGRLYQATNGMQALQILRSHPMDLVFTNVHMPVMDGMELMKKISMERALSRIKVVAISCNDLAVSEDQLRKAGAKAFLRKPFTPDMLNKVIQEVFTNHTSHGPRQIC